MFAHKDLALLFKRLRDPEAWASEGRGIGFQFPNSRLQSPPGEGTGPTKHNVFGGIACRPRALMGRAAGFQVELRLGRAVSMLRDSVLIA